MIFVILKICDKFFLEEINISIKNTTFEFQKNTFYMLFNHSYLMSKSFPNSLLLVFVFIAFLSCQTKQKELTKESEKVIIKQSFKDEIAANNAESYQLLNYSCLYCHGMKEVKENIPTMKAIHVVYKEAYPLKNDFVNTFISFTRPTSERIDLMKSNAIGPCDLMQKDAEYAPEDIDEIAVYLFDFNFEL